MRALDSNITLFILNVIGIGLGPQIVGVVSDLLAPAYGQESLRMALLFLGIVYYLAGKTLHQARSENADRERAAAAA